MSESIFLLFVGPCLASVSGVCTCVFNDTGNFHPKVVSWKCLFFGVWETWRARCYNSSWKHQVGNILSALEEWSSRYVKHCFSQKHTHLWPPSVMTVGKESLLGMTRVVLLDLSPQVLIPHSRLLWNSRSWEDRIHGHVDGVLNPHRHISPGRSTKLCAGC